VQTHRAVAQVQEGVVTVTGVPAADGEVVQVIVIRGKDDAERYSGASSTLSAAEEPMAWDGEGWDEFARIDVPAVPDSPPASAADAVREIGCWQGESYEQLVELFAGVCQRPSPEGPIADDDDPEFP
jgi:hypothetical protein